MILEALASGYSPATGAIIENESVLNERNVIRALQIAINRLKREEDAMPQQTAVEISDEEINTAMRLFEDHNTSPAHGRLACFFLASRFAKEGFLRSHELYGKYKGIYQRGQLMDFFAAYFGKAGLSRYGKRIKKEVDELRARSDFFQKELFNNLSEEAEAQLQSKVNELEMSRTENLSDLVKNARKNYPRSYEPWTDIEEELLWEALQYTNDLRLLSRCFQRGQVGIEQRGQLLIARSKEQL